MTVPEFLERDVVLFLHDVTRDIPPVVYFHEDSPAKLHAEVSDYWQAHYVFDKPSPRRRKTFGSAAIHLLVINTIAPFLFFYGKKTNRDDLGDRALKILEALPPESNAIMDAWADAGIAARNSYESQALLQLTKKYCSEKRCLECAIGHFLLK